MENLDFESWRCKHDINIFCPPEGCPKEFGCARDKGWEPGQPTPEGCLPKTSVCKTPKGGK